MRLWHINLISVLPRQQLAEYEAKHGCRLY